MKKNRRTVLDAVFKHEGGYAERDTEGGGAVNMGVTYDTLCDWRKKHKKPKPTWADLKALTRQEAEEIYSSKYLDPIGFDQLPGGVDYMAYDFAVLSGPSRAVKTLQQVLGFTGKQITGKADGPTMWAVNHRDLAQLITKYSTTRHELYKTFPTYRKVAVAKSGKTWGAIWLERITAVENKARKMMEPNQ
jgi:lysozyme family protein